MLFFQCVFMLIIIMLGVIMVDASVRVDMLCVFMLDVVVLIVTGSH
jgi:hypothetical protein